MASETAVHAPFESARTLPPAHPALPLWLRASALVASFIVGVMGALQAAINRSCAQHFGGYFLSATVISFGGGLVLLTVAVAVEGRGLRWSRLPAPHHLLPGALGATFVTLSLSLTLVTGFALFFVLSAVGFLSMGLLIDARALFNAPRRPATAVKVACLLLACVGAAMSTAERLAVHVGDGQPAWLLAVCVLLALCAGFLLPIQATINRDAASRLPSRIAASWWSFACGLVAAAVGLGVEVGARPALRAGDITSATGSSAWWMWMGGPLGVVYIVSGIWGVSVVGAAAWFVALLCGQLAGSAAFDAVGALGAVVTPVTALRVAGIVIVVAAAAGMQTSEVCAPHQWRRRRGGARAPDARRPAAAALRDAHRATAAGGGGASAGCAADDPAVPGPGPPAGLPAGDRGVAEGFAKERDGEGGTPPTPTTAGDGAGGDRARDDAGDGSGAHVLLRTREQQGASSTALLAPPAESA